MIYKSPYSNNLVLSSGSVLFNLLYLMWPQRHTTTNTAWVKGSTDVCHVKSCVQSNFIKQSAPPFAASLETLVMPRQWNILYCRCHKTQQLPRSPIFHEQWGCTMILWPLHQQKRDVLVVLRCSTQSIPIASSMVPRSSQTEKELYRQCFWN